MTLDNEQQRSMILQMISAPSIPGNAIDFVYQLKQSVQSAIIEAKDEGNIPHFTPIDKVNREEV